MEVPSISASSYVSNTIDHAFLGGQQLAAQGNAFGGHGLNDLAELWKQQQNAALPNQAKEKHAMSNARIVKVFIADPNENLPLDKRVLHSGEEKLTDLTDQELFFEVPINDMLKKHNEYRVTVVDKKQAEKFGRDIMLEPVRIKDLKMVVVTVASF